MTRTPPIQNLTATALRAELDAGRLSAEQVARAHLDRIAEREPEVQAFTFLDPEHVLGQARRLDQLRKRGGPQGPLFGLPVVVKDIVDTADMPTELGSPIHAGRRPRHDAAVVEQLRAAGAIVVGKAVTAEFATYHPGKTRNPHDTGRTPGGSSSGSAAAVGAGMTPFGIGTQTNGSVIRPASYCGVYGYKPTHGLISRHGVLGLSRALDHVGLFARSIDDLALLAEPLMAYDARDPDMRPLAPPPLRATLAAEWPLAPDLAFVRTPVWDQGEPDLHAAFAELVEALGPRIAEAELPGAFDDALETHRLIMEPDIAYSLARDFERGGDAMSARLREIVERGRNVSAVDYKRALDRASALERSLEPVFDRFDAILTPAATGEAPTPETTGSPAFCTIWSLLGMPAVSVPLMAGANGLPIGVQLVGRRGDDARLLRTARWLVDHLRTETAGDARA